jgi:hypothetical protein
MDDRERWLNTCTSCKIGTMPMLVRVHAADRKKLAPGKWARVMYAQGGKWERVLVRRVDPGGYFQADK